MLPAEMPLLPCLHKQILGFSCPICGLQRSLILLWKGEVWASIVQFPPLPLLAVTPFVLAFLLLRHSHQKYYGRLGIAWLATLAFNWLYQNIAF